MKKLFGLVLSIVIILSLFSGCSESGNNETTAEAARSLSVGFGRTNINPTESVPLGGYGNASKRMSQSIQDDIYATCVAITDDADNTVLLYHLDLVRAPADDANLRMTIGKKVGVSGGNIFLAATHNHSSPATQNAEISIERYNEYLKDQLIKAAEEAMADRKTATMHIARAYPEGLNFVRHYWLSDGTSWDGHHGFKDPGETLINHITEPDNQLQMLKFVREGAEDVVLVNWQAHPHRNGGGKSSTYVSSDLVGAMRDYLEKELGCKFAYYSGAGGNMNSTSQFPDENAAADHIEHGQKLGQFVIDAYDTFQQVDAGTVQVKTTSVTLDHYPADENQLLIAGQMNAIYQKDGNTKECRELGRPYGIHDAFHANSILARAQRPATGSFSVSAFSIGDVAFAVAPYEMFDTNGKQIKDTSSFDMTFIVCYCNGAYGYIPSAYGYEYGCYESDTTRFAPGSGEIMEQTYIDLLNTLYETK